MLAIHDLHMHTTLSACCSDPLHEPANILARAREQGLELIGFADHFWDERMSGASAWYATQNYDHVAGIRCRLPADNAGVRVLLGCESEFWGRGRCGIGPDAAARFDFVLLPVSHFHMRQAGVPRDLDDQSVGNLLVRRLREALELDHVTGIAHPFLPLGFIERVDAIVNSIPASALEDCLALAAQKGVSIEVTTAFSPPAAAGSPGRSEETFLRLLTIAKNCGCLFHCASDAHRLDDVGTVRRLEPYLRRAGIGEADFHPVTRLPPKADSRP